jgi:DNA-binding transcriptional MerR regulator
MQSDRLMKVGELATAVGKSVRAIHLYEELGLLHPVARSAGGFRQFDASAVDRIRWIGKLQAIGFSLPEIQAFIRDFEEAPSGRVATDRVRELFVARLQHTRDEIAALRGVEAELLDALSYLDDCRPCETHRQPADCHQCDNQGHDPARTPALFSGLAAAVVERRSPIRLGRSAGRRGDEEAL